MSALQARLRRNEAMRRGGERLATDAQWVYVQRLMREAFANLYDKRPNIDVHHRPHFYTMDQASRDIEQLKAAKVRGWKAVAA